MATKKTTKKTTTKAAAKATKAPVNKNRGMTVKECIAQSQMLKMHMTVIAVLSIIVCLLVLALVLALKD